MGKTVIVDGSDVAVMSRPSASKAANLSQPKKRKMRWSGKNIALFALFAGPNVFLLIAFVYRPMVLSLYYSLLQWNVGSPNARFIGLSNYVEWLNSPSTGPVVRSTIIFSVATVGGALVLGLALAIILNQRLAGRGLARTVVFAPYVLSGVAVGMLWLYIFDPRYGLLSSLLGKLGMSSPQWYSTWPWALIMIIIVYLWKNVGYVTLIYLAGLQAVPQDLRDASALDGASKARTFRSVVMPMLGPITLFILITTTLSSLQSFDIIRAMTQGGPLGTTTTIMYQIYREGFISGRAGYASAVATILFVILMAVTAFQFIVMERKVHYS